MEDFGKIIIVVFLSFISGIIFTHYIVFPPAVNAPINTTIFQEKYVFEFSLVKDDLEQYWYNTDENEYGVCLDGFMDGNKTIITGLTDFVLGTKNMTSAYWCSNLGHLHKHPNGIPYLSQADYVSSYERYNKGEKIFIVQYDYNKFIVYTPENWKEGMKVGI